MSKLSKLKKGLNYFMIGLGCAVPVIGVGILAKYAASYAGLGYASVKNKRKLKRADKKSVTTDCVKRDDLTDVIYANTEVVEKIGGEGLYFVNNPEDETVVKNIKEFKKEVDPLLDMLYWDVEENNRMPETFEEIKTAVRLGYAQGEEKNKILKDNASELQTLLDFYVSKNILDKKTIKEKDENGQVSEGVEHYFFNPVGLNFVKQWVFDGSKIITLGTPNNVYSKFEKVNIIPRKYYKSMRKYVHKGNLEELNKHVKTKDEVLVKQKSGEYAKTALGDNGLSDLSGKEVILPSHVLIDYNSRIKYDKKLQVPSSA